MGQSAVQEERALVPVDQVSSTCRSNTVTAFVTAFASAVESGHEVTQLSSLVAAFL